MRSRLLSLLVAGLLATSIAALTDPRLVAPAHAAGPYTIGTSTSTSQHSTWAQPFYNQGAWFAAYSDGTNVQMKYTTDSGATWTSLGSVVGAQGSNFDWNLTGNTVYYVREVANAGAFYWRYGTLSSGHSVTWSISETSVPIDSGHGATECGYLNPGIAVDSSGHVFVSLCINDTTDYSSCSSIYQGFQVWEYASSAWSKAADLKVCDHPVSSMLRISGNNVVMGVQYTGSQAGGLIYSTDDGATWSASTSSSLTTMPGQYWADFFLYGSNVYWASDYNSGGTWYAYYGVYTLGQSAYVPTGNVVFFNTEAKTSTVQITGLGLANNAGAFVVTYARSGSSLFALRQYGNFLGTNTTVTGGETDALYLLASMNLDASDNLAMLWVSGSSSPYNVRFVLQNVPTSEISGPQPIQQATCGSSSTSGLACAYPFWGTSGDVQAVFAATYSASGCATASVTDSLSDTFTQEGSTVSYGTTVKDYFYVSTFASSSADTVTFGCGGSGYSIGTSLYEVSQSLYTGIATSSGASSAPSTSAVSYVSGDVIVSFVSYSGGTDPSAASSSWFPDGTSPNKTPSNVYLWSDLMLTSSSSSFTTGFGSASLTTWGQVNVDFSPPTTQPITVTVSGSGPSTTGTISGCEVTPTVIAFSGVTSDFVAQGSCTLTIHVPSDSATSRYRFPSSATTFTFSTCPSGTCSNEAVTVYAEEYDGVSYSVTGGGAGVTAPVLTYQVGGVGGQTATLSTTSSPVWIDYGSSYSATDPLAGSTGSERWGSGAASGTAGTALIVVPYYHQYAGNFSYSVSGGGSPTAPTLTYTSFGDAATTATLTGSTTSYWVDGSGAWSVSPDPLGGSTSTERWEASSSSTSGTATASFADALTYYHQFSEAVSYSLLGGGTFSPPSLSYTYLGTAGTTTTMDLAPANVWVDDGSGWTGTNPLPTSTSSQRAYSSAPSGTVSSSGTIAPAYYNQLSVLVSYTLDDSAATSVPTFKIYQLGVQQTENNAKVPAAYWVDSNSPWTAESPWTTSPDLKTFYGAPAAGQAATTAPIVVAYGATASSACVGSNPLTVFEANPTGCFVPFLFAVWDANTGPVVYFSFILLGVNVMIYNKSQSVVMSLIVMLALGVAFGYLLPSSVQLIANIFLYLSIAGIGLRFVTALRS